MIMNQVTKRLLLVTVGIFSAMPAMAEEVEKTIDASPNGVVSISNTAGSVQVVGWSRNEVAVEADLGRDVIELIVERDGDEVVIEVRIPRHNARRISSDLEIRVPENSSVDVAAVSADIEVEDVFGELRLTTVSGDIQSAVYESDVQVESVSGDIELLGDGGYLLLEVGTVSGDIELDSVNGSVEAGSVSGDIELLDGSYDRAQADTVNGDIVFQSELRSGGKLQIETINGDVDINFAGTVSARFEIETFNGGIDNCFGPEPERTSRYTPGRELSFTEGDGTSRVIVETLNGGISICRN
jgi:DUF4097 and DUF4098 domain-containing protein YvlB